MRRLFLPLALACDTVPRAELRWEIAGIALGVVLLAIGLAAVALFLSAGSECRFGPPANRQISASMVRVGFSERREL